MREYRKRIRKDPIRLAELQEKERQRLKDRTKEIPKIENLSTIKKPIQREKWKKALQAYRNRQKMQKHLEQNTPPQSSYYGENNGPAAAQVGDDAEQLGFVQSDSRQKKKKVSSKKTNNGRLRCTETRRN